LFVCILKLVISTAEAYPYTRACLDQILIAIRSLTTFCDHSWSKPRLIAFMDLMPLWTTALDYVSINCHCRRSPHHAYSFIQTLCGERGQVGSSESVAAAVCCGFL